MLCELKVRSPFLLSNEKFVCPSHRCSETVRRKPKQIKVIPLNGISMPPKWTILVGTFLLFHHLASSCTQCSLSSKLCILSTTPYSGSSWISLLHLSFISLLLFFLVSSCCISNCIRITLKFKMAFIPLLFLTYFPKWLFFLHSCWWLCRDLTHWRHHHDPGDLLLHVTPY